MLKRSAIFKFKYFSEDFNNSELLTISFSIIPLLQKCFIIGFNLFFNNKSIACEMQTVYYFSLKPYNEKVKHTLPYGKYFASRYINRNLFWCSPFGTDLQWCFLNFNSKCTACGGYNLSFWITHFPHTCTYNTFIVCALQTNFPPLEQYLVGSVC